MLVGMYHLSNLITYLGMASATLGICLSAGGRVRYGMICLILSGVCDLFDGVFARRFRRTEAQKEFGVQVDSLADVVSFGALPVALMYGAGLSRWYYIPVFVLYIFATVTRLAYFNLTVSGADAPVSHYRGMPVTYAAFFFPLLWMLSFLLPPVAFHAVYAAAALVIALLFVLNVRIPKPRGAAYVFFSIMAAGTTAAILILG